MVRVNKPAQVREDPITDKTGGCNNDAGSIGKNSDLPARKGNRSRWKVTGGAYLSKGLHPRARMQFEWLVEVRESRDPTLIAKDV
jgi:hypothetical protein